MERTGPSSLPASYGHVALACHHVCPKNLPLSTQIAFMRRKMAAAGWSGPPFILIVHPGVKQ
jgi:L-lactate utilization protein LutB